MSLFLLSSPQSVHWLTTFVSFIHGCAALQLDQPAVHLLSELWPALTDTLNIFGSVQYISESQPQSAGLGSHGGDPCLFV